MKKILRLKFLQQPTNLQTFTFTLTFTNLSVKVCTGVFVTGIPIAGQIAIGANLSETISNTKTFIDSTITSPSVQTEIASNEIVLMQSTFAFEPSSITEIASVLSITEETLPMKKIFIRSPYFIEVNEPFQISAKIEVFLWNKGTAEPTTPNYTLSKNIPSVSQTKLYWNISNYAKAFIKPIAPVLVTEPTEENVNTWCYMKVKRYSDNVLLDTETFVCLNGYSLYSDGYNYSTTDAVVPLVNTDVKLYTHTGFNYINAWLEADDYNWSGNDDYIFSVTSDGLWKLPYNSGRFTFQPEVGIKVFIIDAEQVCEPKYTPITCTFINRFGGWQYLTFFKASSSSIETTSKDFNMLPSNVNYNVLQGQKQRFNFQGKQKIKCNTGWVDENYHELIQDLLLSEVVLLDSKPAIVKSQSFDIKTSLKDKVINYEIEFEYNYGLINDVV